MSTAYTRRRVAGGEMALSCCALTADGKHAVAGESWFVVFGRGQNGSGFDDGSDGKHATHGRCAYILVYFSRVRLLQACLLGGEGAAFCEKSRRHGSMNTSFSRRPPRGMIPAHISSPLHPSTLS